MRAKILKNAKTDIPEYFEDFKKFWNTSIKEINDEDLTDIYLSTLIFKNWKKGLNTLGVKAFDNIIDEIYEDINASFFLALLGLYRSSHLHMRSSIELSMQLLYFLHHPIEFILWKKGDYVIKHDKLIEYLTNHPNFSISIVDLLSNITRNWKHFSKHIHGESPNFFQCVKEAHKTNKFTKKDFGIWKSNFLQNIYYINKLFLYFFKNDLNNIPENARNLILSTLNEKDTEIFFAKTIGSSSPSHTS